MSSPPPSNPIASITNKLESTVDIYDVFNPSTDPGTLGPLTYTKLATVPSGSTQQVQTIHFASQLQAMFTGKVDALNGNYYQQLPIAVLGVSPFNDSNDYTITSDMQQAMVDSFKFIKYSQANPSSQLATQFRTALGDKTSQKDAVNKFFQSTASFKLCTMTTWTAVFTWQAQFTSPWQGTYYLYSLGSSSAGDDSSSSAPALVATLAITSSASASSAVLTMAGTDNENTAVVMGGDGTMQEQNQGTGNLSVVLTPSWLNVAQVSLKIGKVVINYVIGAAFTGTINGVKVAGNLNKLSTTNKKNSANGFSLSTLEGLVGMLTGIGVLYYMAKGSKQAETQKKNNEEEKATSKKDAEKKAAEVEKSYQANDVPQVQAQAEKVEKMVPQVKEGYKEVGQAQDIQSKQDVVQEQEIEMVEILQSGAPSQAVEDTAMSLQKANDKLTNSTDPKMSADERDTTLTEASDILSTTSANIEQTLKAEGDKLSKQEADALENTQDALEKVEEQAKAEEKNRQDQEDRDNENVSEEVDDTTFENPEPRVEGAI